MQEWFGWIGKVLRADLSNRSLRVEQLDRKMALEFVGGKGFAAKLLFDELKPRIDPLGPENKIIVATGPLAGLNVQGCSRLVIATKSPLTGIFIDSYAGGPIAPQLKYAGFDVVVIEGISSKPVYLYIRDGQAEIRQATHIWGKTSHETEDVIKEETAEDATVISIGPAGENLVKFACISAGNDHHAGRGGVGTVMGCKRLKAIAVKGEKRPDVAEPAPLDKALKELRSGTIREGKNPSKEYGLTHSCLDLTHYGSTAFLAYANKFGVFPTRNFQTGSCEGFEKVFDALKHLEKKHSTCPGCVIACVHSRAVRSGKYAGVEVGGPHYESIGMLGANCGIDDANAIIKATSLCDELGLDTISTGNVVAFAMECYERGILTDKDTNNLKLTFGNAEAQIDVIKKIAMREAIGDVLAEGVKYASEKFGKGSERFAMHVKGLEMPSWEPRGRLCYGLAYATADVGAHHERGWPSGTSPRGHPIPNRSGLEKVETLILGQNHALMYDILIACTFTSFTPITTEGYLSLLSMATGVKYDTTEFDRAGERVWNLVRAFNVREGTSRKDDKLPWRQLHEPTMAPYAKGCRAFISEEDFEKCLNEYYAIRGWDHEGIPTREKLTELGLENALKDLYDRE